MTISRSIRFIFNHPLTRRQPIHAMSRYLKWQLVSRVHTDTIVNWVSGTRVAVRRGMTGFTGNIYCGLHEFADMGFLLHVLEPEDTFIDVGANVGSYTILASGVCGATTIAFQPPPVTAAFLRRHIDMNKPWDRVCGHQRALWHTPAE